MQLKSLVKAVALTGSIIGASAYAANDQDMHKIKQQIKQLQAKVNAMESSKGSGKNQGSSNMVIQKNSDLSHAMMNNQQTVKRELNLLSAVQSGEITPNSLTIGAKGQLSAIGQTKAGADNRSGIAIQEANVAVTGNADKWLTGYAELHTTTGQSVDLENYYLVAGDLDSAPIYAWAGEKTVNFGDFSNEASVFPSLLSGYFSIHGAQAGVGFHDSMGAVQLTLNGTLVNGGGVGNVNSVNSSNHISGVALDASMKAQAAKDLSFTIGGGYSSTSGFVAQGSTDSNVGVFDLRGQMTMGNEINNLQISAEGVVTDNNIGGVAGTNGTNGFQNDNTGNGGADTLASLLGYGGGIDWGNQSSGAMKGVNADIAYTAPMLGKSTVIQGGYNVMFQSSDAHMSMWNAGVRTEVASNVWVGAEYALAYGNVKANSTGDSIKTSNNLLVKASAFF